MELTGKTALVTGASSGIGRALAKRLAGEGVRVAVVARREDQLDKLAEEVERSGAARPVVLVADLAARGVAEEVGAAAVETLGRVDVLVNNAGGAVAGRQAVVGDRDEGRETFDLNVWSPLALVGRLVPYMQERNTGAVVNVTSMMQVMTWPFMGYYTASKAALASFTETLRLELRGSGVQVLEVIPGPVDTPIYAESQLVSGVSAAMGPLRPGDPDVLARKVVRALRRDQPRLVYPAILRIPYLMPFLVRSATRAQLRRAGDDIDLTDGRILRSGSNGDEIALAARRAWENGQRDLAALEHLAGIPGDLVSQRTADDPR